MNTPYLTIDLSKIEHNARTLVQLCAAHGVQVSGVTKCVRGHPDIARAMLRGGVTHLADSRLPNLQRLRDAGLEDHHPMLIRLPPLSAIDSVVEEAETSLNSEPTTLEALSATALRHGRPHGVLLMVELGDLREGIPPADLPELARLAHRLPGIQIKGIGTNLACLAGVAPTVDNMNRLVKLAEAVEKITGEPMQWISGANSSALTLIAEGAMPQRINHARLGESILLGRETLHRRPWPDTHQDAFVLHAEVLEFQRKPSHPRGERGEDAFGHQPNFQERGEIHRALLNVGREDVDVDGIEPLEPGVEILGATSGYLVLDVTRAERKIAVGDEIAFSLNYAALLAAMTSEYVHKRPI